MKRMIYPKGRFECELMCEESEQNYMPGPRLCYAEILRPNYKMTKTSSCVVRYEAEPYDDFVFHKLREELKTPLDIANGLSTQEESEEAWHRFNHFLQLRKAASSGKEEIFQGMQYIETSNSYTLHSQAIYRYNWGAEKIEIPCKVGEMLTQTLNPETYRFE